MQQQKIYGYIRVSTKEQNEDRQLIAMREFPVEKKNIYLDKFSGKDFNRPQYQKLMRRIKKNDVIVVKSIDRLGRDYEEIQNRTNGELLQKKNTPILWCWICLYWTPGKKMMM